MHSAATASEYKILLEAYHPSRRYTGPYLFCTYLGTDGLTAINEQNRTLDRLNSFYSRFRPEYPNVEGSLPARRIAGATPVLSVAATGGPGTGQPQADGWSTTAGLSTPVYANAGDGGVKKIKHWIHLDGGELFGQFCAYSSLVRLGPRRGVFLSTVNVVEPGQGIIRVWRDWLTERCRVDCKDLDAGLNQDEELIQPTIECYPDLTTDRAILWIDYTKTVGLRLKVNDRSPDKRVLSDALDADDEPLFCEMEIEGIAVPDLCDLKPLLTWS